MGSYGGAPMRDRNSFAGQNLRNVDYGSQQLQPITKNFYVEAPVVAGRTQEEVGRWIAENQVSPSREAVATIPPRLGHSEWQGHSPPGVQL